MSYRKLPASANDEMTPLEIMSQLPTQASDKPPLLFVHGSFLSAWCWDEHFLPFYARCGYPSFALSLRGHGASAGFKQLDQWGVADYVNDISAAVKHIINGYGQMPILIGHSMGAYIVQRYLLQQQNASKAALLAPVPPQGLLPLAWWLTLTQPWLMQHIAFLQSGFNQAHHAQGHQAKLLSRTLFSTQLPVERARQYLARSQRESQRVLLEMYHWDILLLSYQTLRNKKLLVLGAAEDVLIPQVAVHATAAVYQTQAQIIPDIAHIMMLEPNWKSVARVLLEWLEQC